MGRVAAGTRAQDASTTLTTTLMSCRLPSPLTWLTLFAFAAVSHGYTFNITSSVKQCENIDISIVGSGSPPYSVVIIPYGPSPLANGIEARKIVQQNWTGSSTSLSFQLQYPAYSQFIAIVSDSTGFGSGGTSAAATVLNGTSGCFDSSQNVSPQFSYSIVPTGSLTQCGATRIWWDPTKVEGTPQFYGIIPGGNSLQIPQGSLSTVANEGVGFNWTVDVRTGTNFILMGGDNRGIGSGGSAQFSISGGITGNDNNGCLSSSSPSSTPGSPAGGAYPTSTSGAGTDGSSGSGSNSGSGSSSSGGSSTNVAAIVGGTVGGVAGLIILLLLALFFMRRRRFHRAQREKPVDLLPDEGDHPDHEATGHDANYLQPEPFLSTQDDSPRNSRYSEFGGLSSAQSASGVSGPVGGAGTRTSKSATAPSLRPVNIIQHDDAGLAPQHEDNETIELPPAYTNIKRNKTLKKEENSDAAQAGPSVPGPSSSIGVV